MPQQNEEGEDCEEAGWRDDVEELMMYTALEEDMCMKRNNWKLGTERQLRNPIHIHKHTVH